MHLIEKAGAWSFPFFAADSITDIRRSRSEIEALLDPKHVRLYRSSLYLPIDVLLFDINHDRAEYDNSLGIWLYDSSDEVNVRVPNKLAQIVGRLFGDDRDFDYLIRTSWRLKPVVLTISYIQSQGYSTDESSHHTLAEVLDIQRPDYEAEYAENRLTQLAPGLAGI